MKSTTTTTTIALISQLPPKSNSNDNGKLLPICSETPLRSFPHSAPLRFFSMQEPLPARVSGSLASTERRTEGGPLYVDSFDHLLCHLLALVTTSWSMSSVVVIDLSNDDDDGDDDEEDLCSNNHNNLKHYTSLNFTHLSLKSTAKIQLQPHNTIFFLPWLLLLFVLLCFVLNVLLGGGSKCSNRHFGHFGCHVRSLFVCKDYSLLPI